jgi:hypothetical protein
VPVPLNHLGFREPIAGAATSYSGEEVGLSTDSTAPDAFAEFVTGSYAGLVRTGYLLSGDRGLAEDLVQQRLLSTHRRWARPDEIGSAEAYTRTSLTVADRSAVGSESHP